ncbi:MAG: dihydropteroate synthase [Nocardioides sp.]
MTTFRPASVRPLVMGILNVTPDSFSDGGLWAAAEAAVEHGLAMADAGADIVDVGGESTRPGALRPAPAEELARVLPVVAELTARGVPVSIDTMRAEVALAAVDAGARVVNDVSGGLADPEMLGVVAAASVDYVAMHWRAPSERMQDFARYDGPGGVVAAVRSELSARVDAAHAAGIDSDRLILDPGLGFAKTGEHNWTLLSNLGSIGELGLPLLVGASRKAFFGQLLADAEGVPRPVGDREHAHAALAAVLAVSARCRIWGFRAHDVRATRDALAVVAALHPGETSQMRGEASHEEAVAT